MTAMTRDPGDQAITARPTLPLHPKV